VSTSDVLGGSTVDAMTLLEDIKRHGCPATFALPVFFCFHGGLTLLFGGLAVISVKDLSQDIKVRNGSWIAIAIGIALIVAAVCHIVVAFGIIPALQFGPRSRYKGSTGAYGNIPVPMKSEETMSTDFASASHRDGSALSKDSDKYMI
jgi:hypothetical protein